MHDGVQGTRLDGWWRLDGRFCDQCRLRVDARSAVPVGGADLRALIADDARRRRKVGEVRPVHTSVLSPDPGASDI